MTIRVSFLSVVGLALFSASAPALDKFGFLTGINLSSAERQLTQAQGPEFLETRVGPYVEGSFQLPIVQNLSFFGGLAFVGKGAKAPGVTSSYSFFELPMRLKMELPGDKITPYFYGGLSWGMLLSATDRADNTVETDVVNNLRRNELSMLLGVGVEYKISHDTALDFGITYSQGLTNLLYTDAYPEAQRPDVYYRSKGLFVGVGLRISERPEIDDSSDRAREYLERRTQPGGSLPLESPEQTPTEMESELLSE